MSGYTQVCYMCQKEEGSDGCLCEDTPRLIGKNCHYDHSKIHTDHKPISVDLAIKMQENESLIEKYLEEYPKIAEATKDLRKEIKKVKVHREKLIGDKVRIISHIESRFGQIEGINDNIRQEIIENVECLNEYRLIFWEEGRRVLDKFRYGVANVLESSITKIDIPTDEILEYLSYTIDKSPSNPYSDTIASLKSENSSLIRNAEEMEQKYKNQIQALQNINQAIQFQYQSTLESLTQDHSAQLSHKDAEIQQLQAMNQEYKNQIQDLHAEIQVIQSQHQSKDAVNQEYKNQIDNSDIHPGENADSMYKYASAENQVSAPMPLLFEERKEDRSVIILNSQTLDSISSEPTSCLHVIAITGSQSTGKSTLLNSVFGFKYPVMDSYNAGKMTCGIDMAISHALKLACLDMEASDSCDEDNSYIQRVISAFGLTVSNLLIYNIFVRDIRTVREVNSLSKMMISYLRSYKDKRKILFCIRDVSPANNEANLRDKIDRTFKQVINKVSQAVKLGEAEVNEVFEYDIATVDTYIDEKFENEEEVMQRLRAKIEEILTNYQPFQVHNIPDIWNHAWSTIDNDVKLQDSEIILIGDKTRIEETSIRRQKTDNRWSNLKETLTARFYDLMREISLYRDKETSIQELDAEFTSKIESIYQSDPLLKQAVLSFYKEEFVNQAIRLEKERLKLSISRYFEDTSKETANLYSDYILMFKNLDSQDKDRYRVSKSDYISFLHNAAIEQKLYELTISKALNTIYFRSCERISNICPQKVHKSEQSPIHSQVDLSELEAFFSSIYTITTPAIEKIIISAIIGMTVKSAVASSICSAALIGANGSLAAIGGPATLAIGAVTTASSVGVTAAWYRKSVWKSLAIKVREIILNHESFKPILNKVKFMI
jgi:hypothetical protein